MKEVYPVVVTKTKDWHIVYIPDFDRGTQGKDLIDAIRMARDAIGALGISYEDMGKEIPKPNTKKYKASKDDIVTLVDIDFVEYRKQVDNKVVRKNCTIPQWLNVQAERVHINFSKVLTEALERELGISKKR